MAGTFLDRTRMLMDNIGGGRLVGSIILDQVYAKYQHERVDLAHPRGGGPKYLTHALESGAPPALAALARAVLRGDLNIAMSRQMENIAKRIPALAPTEFGDLDKSAHVRVIDRGAVVYDRPGKPRLSEAQIEAKRGGKRFSR